jgi:hypothetical protein
LPAGSGRQSKRSSSEGRAVRTKRVNHAIKQDDRAFSACTLICTVRLKLL